MLFISKQGHVDAERVKLAIHPAIERGPMHKVNGIVVHQTNGPTAQSTFHSYQHKDANGAHFLIDKDGTIYQTASLHRSTNHVGLMKSKCLLEKSCTPAEFKKIKRMDLHTRSRHEENKGWADRFPAKRDSIGIELVGRAFGDKGKEIFENVTDEQNESLGWLIMELSDTLGVSMQSIYRHPEISHKNKTEASTARW